VKLNANLATFGPSPLPYGTQEKIAVAAIKTPRTATLVKGIKRLFRTEPERDWRAHIEAPKGSPRRQSKSTSKTAGSK
jgi:hypothetical protein